MIEHTFDILLPTWNSPQWLQWCVQSIAYTNALQAGMGHLIIVNNGKQPVEAEYKHLPNTLVLTPGENLGWEGALQLGLQHSDAKFVVFQNDDTIIPRANYQFYEKLLVPFLNRNVAMVGPTTTTASGIQSIFHPRCPGGPIPVNWMIFFTVMLRRSHLDAVGGIDANLPGGDDFDLSIRLRRAGYELYVNPQAFLVHAGFQTGERLHGGADKIGGWNSKEMQERTNHALIVKHGFREFFHTMSCQEPLLDGTPLPDHEGDVVRTMLNGEAKIVELGCGGMKTVPQSVGVDALPQGAASPVCHGFSAPVCADVQADVTKPLPWDAESVDAIIARHILEHCVDSVTTLRQWRHVLRPGGKLIVAVPDQDLVNGIPLSPDHCHAFDASSLQTLVESVGFRQLHTQPSGNSISFVSCFEKVVDAQPLG